MAASVRLFTSFIVSLAFACAIACATGGDGSPADEGGPPEQMSDARSHPGMDAPSADSLTPPQDAGSTGDSESTGATDSSGVSDSTGTDDMAPPTDAGPPPDTGLMDAPLDAPPMDAPPPPMDAAPPTCPLLSFKYVFEYSILGESAVECSLGCTAKQCCWHGASPPVCLPK